MSLKKVALVAVAGVLLAGCTPFTADDSQEDMMESEAEMREEQMMDDSDQMQQKEMMDEEAMMEEGAMSYTLAEVAEHATVDDCWVVVADGVYDVTTFVKSGEHPGGDISAACGTDATMMFSSRNGSGPHPETAEEYLASMQVGLLQNDQ